MVRSQAAYDSDCETLSPQLQHLKHCYLDARKRTGEAILEAARWLSEARNIARYGEWHLFLRESGTSEDNAERLLHIHNLATKNPLFAEAIRSNWLGETAAGLLARPSTPPDTILEVLKAPESLNTRQIERTIRERKSAKVRSAADFESRPCTRTTAGVLGFQTETCNEVEQQKHVDQLIARLPALLVDNDRNEAILVILELLATLVFPHICCFTALPY
jgi:hypothetical protein